MVYKFMVIGFSIVCPFNSHKNIFTKEKKCSEMLRITWGHMSSNLTNWD